MQRQAVTDFKHEIALSIFMVKPHGKENTKVSLASTVMHKTLEQVGMN